MFLARDIRHDRKVAIKVLRPELAETLGADRFTREIRTAANLSNPHILTVLDSGSADGLLYYVMPFAEGESLRRRIAREGALPIEDVIRILREVADALSTAHAAGVVHRDIKPDNVLLSGRHALVADFGVAKALSESSGRNKVTTIGIALGTPAYMAPEQAAADPHVDHRADIYALGVLAFEMLTGEPPFSRRSPQELLAAHVTEPAPPVSSRRPSVPPALDALVAKCLLKQPGDRYQSADQVLEELERMVTPTAGVSPAAGLPPTAATPAAVRPSSTRLAALTVVALLLLAAAWFGGTKQRARSAADANVVAVLPFEYSGGPDLAYLKEGIVNVLEANLTGEAGPRAVASQTIIAQWKRRGGDTRGLTEDEARALAAETGAGQILRGSIVAAGARLVVSATLTDVRGSRNPVQARVEGPADSIAPMATRLAGQLLSLHVGEARDRIDALQSVPPAALRAYLIGQQRMRESRFLEAHQAFSTALGLDSTFALAAMGLNHAENWSPINFAGTNANLIAYRHRANLGPRDSIILHMWMPSRFAGKPLSLREIMDLRERLVQQVPDRPEAWYLIGDDYFHRGPAMGLSREEASRRAEHAFRRALALDPQLTYVQGHVAQLHLAQASFDRMKQVADSLGLSLPEIDIAQRVMSGDSLDVDRYRSRLDGLNAEQLVMVSWFSSGTPLGDHAYEQALARSTSGAQRLGLLEGGRDLYWMQGRPAMARKAHDQLRALGAAQSTLTSPRIIYAGLFNDADSTLTSDVAAATARRLQLGVARPEPTRFADRAPALAVGLWAAREGDSAAVRAAIARLEAIGARQDSVEQAATARLFASALRLVVSPGPPDRADLDVFDGVMSGGPSLPAPAPETRSALNLIASRSWERIGDAARGIAAAERAATWDATALVQHTALRDVGRLKLATGDTAGAIDAWKQYLMSRGRAEPAQRKADDEIRRTLAQIERLKR